MAAYLPWLTRLHEARPDPIPACPRRWKRRPARALAARTAAERTVESLGLAALATTTLSSATGCWARSSS
jgi:hypothetical protein